MAAKKESKGGVILTDHNTGKTHEFADIDAANSSYVKINERDDKRGFSPNYTITDAVTGEVLHRQAA